MGNCCPGCSLTLAMQVLEQLRLHGEGLGLEGSCRGNFVLLKMVFLALLEFPQEVGTEYDGSRRPLMVAMPYLFSRRRFDECLEEMQATACSLGGEIVAM